MNRERKHFSGRFLRLWKVSRLVAKASEHWLEGHGYWVIDPSLDLALEEEGLQLLTPGQAKGVLVMVSSLSPPRLWRKNQPPREEPAFPEELAVDVDTEGDWAELERKYAAVQKVGKQRSRQTP